MSSEITVSETEDVAEWIIDETCLVFQIFYISRQNALGRKISSISRKREKMSSQTQSHIFKLLYRVKKYIYQAYE